MFSSFWKAMPLLTLGWGVSLQAQDEQNVSVMEKSDKPQVMNCTGSEPGKCWVRGCSADTQVALEADILYWRTENTGFTYSFAEKHMVAAHDSGGSIMRPPTHWAPGLRLGIGWNTDYDHWDVFADWTWYHNKNDTTKSFLSATTGTNQGYYPMFPLASGTTTVHYRDVDVKDCLQYNSGYLELGRAYYLAKTITLRPHLGLEASWIHQKFESLFSNPVIAGEPTIQNFHGKNNFWGMGPRIGFHSKWIIDNSNWSVLCKTSASLLAGNTSTRFREMTEFFAYNSNVHDHFTHLVPHLQMFLGLDWGTCYHNNGYFVGFNAGWEVNMFFNQFNLLTTYPSTTGTIVPVTGTGGQPLTMEGLTINVHLDF